MEKLTHLCYENNSRWTDESRWSWEQLPIHTGILTIASPCELDYYQGFWEIKVEREELFRNIYDNLT